jgi:hypothetical protein
MTVIALGSGCAGVTTRQQPGPDSAYEYMFYTHSTGHRDMHRWAVVLFPNGEAVCVRMICGTWAVRLFPASVDAERITRSVYPDIENCVRMRKVVSSGTPHGPEHRLGVRRSEALEVAEWGEGIYPLSGGVLGSWEIARDFASSWIRAKTGMCIVATGGDVRIISADDAGLLRRLRCANIEELWHR